jgi:hypothetical protein
MDINFLVLRKMNDFVMLHPEHPGIFVDWRSDIIPSGVLSARSEFGGVQGADDQTVPNRQARIQGVTPPPLSTTKISFQQTCEL